jgi:hypothetical protein
MLHIACRSLRYAHRAVPTQHCDRKALRCAPYLCAHIARCLSLPPPLTPPCHPSLHPPIRVPPSLTPTHLSYHTLSGARRMDRCDRPHGAGYSRCARRRRHAPDLGVVGDVNQVARRRELRPAREPARSGGEGCNRCRVLPGTNPWKYILRPPVAPKPARAGGSTLEYPRVP